ncbi:hypothetical protein [Paludisphaera soli]|uniref:hypothetical protein n=1 Tax=Paludisphaera soli TaxID=2712865 RepID=UPI0013EBC4CB|nr:hypothetical protein [Paludisphaera soli]
MSNASYLIANDIPGGAVGEIGWSPESGDLIADAPHAVPVFWLALFDEADLVLIEAEDEEGTGRPVPSLVTDLEAAKARFRLRRALLAARFPEFDPEWERFDARLADLAARFIKVDFAELWELGDDDFGVAQIQSAARWFETRDEDDFEQLLSAASITGYDLARRTFPALVDSTPRTFHLHGYPTGEEDA